MSDSVSLKTIACFDFLSPVFCRFVGRFGEPSYVTAAALLRTCGERCAAPGEEDGTGEKLSFVWCLYFNDRFDGMSAVGSILQALGNLQTCPNEEALMCEESKQDSVTTSKIEG